MSWSSPIATGRRVEAEATLGARVTVSGVNPGTYISSAYVQRQFNDGDFVEAADSDTVWLATTDPVNFPGVVVLKLWTQQPGKQIQFTDEYHVDAVYGNDVTADGSVSKPYKTIQPLMYALGHPVDKQDAARKIKVFVHGAHSSAPQIIVTQANDFDGIYKEGTLAAPLWVPSRMISFYGAGVKIGDDGTGATGFGNVYQEISSGRRFGATSSEIRHTMSFFGVANCRDTHQRIRNGFHIGGQTRIAVIRRQIATIQGDPSGPNDRVTITLTAGQFPYLPSVSPYASLAVTTQDAGDTVTYSSPNAIANTVAGQGVFFYSLTGTTGVSIDTYYHVVNATPTTFQLALTPGGAPIALTGDGSGVVMGIPNTNLLPPFEFLLCIQVSGTTNYNGSYYITQQLSSTSFVAKRFSGTNSSSALETPASAFFNETDTTGASTAVTHDVVFDNAYQQGTLVSDDGTISGAAPTAGTCVVYARNARLFSGLVCSAALLQRVEDSQVGLQANNGATITSFSRTANVVTVVTSTNYSWAAGMVVTFASSTSGAQTIDGTFLLTGGGFGTMTFAQVGADYGAQVPTGTGTATGYSVVNSVDNISGSSFSGGLVTSTWTYATDDQGLCGVRYNAASKIYVTGTAAAPQARMDANSASSFQASGTWEFPVTFTTGTNLVTRTNHGLWNGAAVSFASIVATTGITVGTTYYVIAVTANTFQLAATPGGAALALTTNGSGIMDVSPGQLPGYIDLLAPTQQQEMLQYVLSQSATAGNTATETTLTSAGVGMLNFPANFFKVGRTLRIEGEGVFSATGSPTVRVRVKLGGTTLMDTTAVVSLNETSRLFTLQADLTCRAVGGAGNFFSQGVFVEYGAASTLPMTMSNTAVSGAINTGAALALDVTVQWGTAAAGNTITMTNLRVYG